MNFFSKYLLLLPLLCLLFAPKADAQQGTELSQDSIFRGTVVDQRNRPLSGVTVFIQEKQGQTVTNRNGEFSLKGSANDLIILKMQGYVTAQHSLGKSPLRISLQVAPADAGEEDNVEIPFATRKKREVPAAVSTLNSNSLPQLPVSDLRQLFSGRVSGLYLSQTNTTPGNDGTDVRVRSINSLTATDARVFVDGTERDLANMDQSEIESVTVLKDAATLAWYGLRGGNGVVLVKTKRGDPNRFYINFDSQVGFQKASSLIRPLNSYDYATLYNEATVNDGGVAPYNATALEAYRNNSSPFLYPSNNYMADYLRKSAPVQRYAFSMGGGRNNVRYFASVGYLNQQGLLNQTETSSFNSNVGFRKLNFRGNVDFEASKYLTVSLNTGVRIENRRSPGTGLTDVLNALYNTPPNAFPIINPDGTLGGTSQYNDNPVGLLQQSGYSNVATRVLLATLNIKQKLDFWVPGLSFNVLGSYDGLGDYLSGLTQQYTVSDLTLATPGSYLTASPVAYRTTTYSNNNLQNEFWAGFDYDKVFNAHSLKVSIRGQRYANKSPERLDYRNQGLAGRVDYSYKQRYFVDLTAGYSGSENFAPGKRYGLFPAVALGWVLSEEAFLKTNPAINYLKLRASYGLAGNGDIGGSRFPFESFYSRNLTSGGYSFGSTPAVTNSATELNLGNPDITWETIRMLNGGFDLRLLDNALGFSADIYQTRRKNILTANVFPSLIGQSAGLVNGGTVTSKGLETSLSYTKRIGQFTLNLNGNLLLSKSRIIAENGQVGLPAYQQTLGHIAGSTLVFLSDGLFQSQAEINASPKQTLAGRVAPGDIKYKDVGGPNGIPDGIIDNNDRVRIDKSSIPNTYYGFGSNFRYGLFDLALQFQGVAGRTINIQSIVYSGPTSFNQESLSRFTPATAAIASYPRLGIADQGNNTAVSDFWLRSGNFLRLKSAEIGFNLPTPVLTKLKVSKARLYVGGFNLFSTNDLGIGVDPEITTAGRGSAYPYFKTYTLGLSVAIQ